ncbi:nitrile hydratase [Rhizobium sp. Root708]|uniref:SH3-like domain-containing protein n=1 Tax=Rhizobium sp. Root708 TaxID=1736592 RepID=UPI0006F24844|nr:SH3-like domain-containing protein [Rhizobium sp. Root708]KRB55334.1 nitrile hydratase [Rhizobium sp. Root708]
MRTDDVEVTDGKPVVFALGEKPIFAAGDRVRISARSPIGHYRVPRYLRGKEAKIESVIDPAAVDNEGEAYGRNAGSRLHYYRCVVSLKEVWPNYAGSSRDALAIEIYETWLERI